MNRYRWSLQSKPLTRAELYALVWEKPMIHVAKRFGISDVALRKTCVKHNIPTPPLGYWAKLTHGKKVHRPALPSLKKGERDAIYLSEQPQKEVPAEVAAARAAALEREASPESKIMVSSERPAKLHPTVIGIERVLKKAKQDHEGFVSCSGPGLVSVKISPNSIHRAVLLIDTFLKAIQHRNYQIADDDEGVAITVDEEQFRFWIQETRDRKPHEPTVQELKRQAEEDRWRASYPRLYPEKSDRKVYSKWDWFPSGRLAFELAGEGWNRWSGSGHVGRWHDRPTKPVEDYFNAAMIALVSTAAQIKHDRAVVAEQERLRIEEEERRQRERARQERAKKRREFLIGKAKEYAQFRELVAFGSHLAGQARSEGTESIDRITRVLNDLIAEKTREFEREELNSEISKLKLFGDDDPL